MDGFSTHYVFHKAKKIRIRGLPNPNEIPSSMTVATGSWDSQKNEVIVWNVTSPDAIEEETQDLLSPSHEPTPIAKYSISGSTNDLKWLHNASSDFLLCATTHGEVRSFKVDLEENKNAMSIDTSANNNGNVWRYHKGEVTSIDVYGDKTEIASVGEDASINIFNFDNLNYHRKIENADGLTINCVKYITSNQLVTASTSSQIRFWDLRQASAKPSAVLREGTSGQLIHSLAVRPNHPDIIATGSSDGVVSVWDLRFPSKFPIFRKQAHTQQVWEIQFHPENPDYLMSCSNDGNLVLWNFNFNVAKPNTPNTVRDSAITTELITPAPFLTSINSLDFEPNFRTLVFAADNESINVFPQFIVAP